jgi:hypothetical protein
MYLWMKKDLEKNLLWRYTIIASYATTTENAEMPIPKKDNPPSISPSAYNVEETEAR